MKRIDFLKLGTASIAGVAMSGMAKHRPADQFKNTKKSAGDISLKKGFMLQTFPSRDDYTLSEQFDMLKVAGFDGVEPESGLNREEVLRAKSESGMEIPSVVVSTHWSSPLSSADANVRKEGLDGVETALRDAEAYGASTILLVPGIVNADVSYDEAYQRSQEEISKMIPLAEELDVTIAIENVWNQFLLSPLEAARYIDELNSPKIKWYLDIGNVMNVGYPEQWVRILGNRIAKLHIKEFSRQKRDEEGLWRGFDVNFLEGDNNWPEIMAALEEIGYNGYGIAEPPFRQENIPPEVWLREHVSERMDKIFARGD
ncbi:sugar phosphate isomerase/epimerase [soil metagenome]